MSHRGAGASGSEAERGARGFLHELKHPISEHRFREVMAYVSNAVLKSIKNGQQPTGPGQGANGTGFNSLPHDVKGIIFEMVNSMPSWIRFNFRKGELVKINSANKEFQVCREWYEDPEIRRGQSRSEQQKETKVSLAENVLGVVASNESATTISEREGVTQGANDQYPLGDLPFIVRLKGKLKTPRVKREIDWFFLGGFLKAKPNIGNLYEIRNCVLGLTDIHDSLERAPAIDVPGLGNLLMSPDSHVEELIILVGDFDKDVQPSQMEDILSFSVDDFPGPEYPRYDANRWITEESRVTERENRKIVSVTNNMIQHLQNVYKKRRHWLGHTLEAHVWKKYVVHDTDNPFSKWLSTPEGHRWLRSKGLEYLSTEASWWWLASELGYPFLETEQGLDWLRSSAGENFLLSPQARLWANTGTEHRRAWYETAQGRDWKAMNFRNGGPPTPPQRPTREANPPPRKDDSWPVYFMTNWNFKGWRFVACPAEKHRSGKN
ncbi:hypothetical protein AAE478_005284 [Parahypoxylon ruwenzoriense]